MWLIVFTCYHIDLPSNCPLRSVARFDIVISVLKSLENENKLDSSNEGLRVWLVVCTCYHIDLLLNCLLRSVVSSKWFSLGKSFRKNMES